MSGEKKEYKWEVKAGGQVPLDSVALKTAMSESFAWVFFY